MPGVKPRYTGRLGIAGRGAGGDEGGVCERPIAGARVRSTAVPMARMDPIYRPQTRAGPEHLRARFQRPSFSSDLADVLRLQALRTLGDFEFDRIALGEAAEALSLDRREVDEHIGTRLLRDKAKALRVVEPLHLTLCHTVWTSALRGTAPDTFDPGHRDQGRAQTKTARQVVLAVRRQTGDGATYCLNRGQR